MAIVTVTFEDLPNDEIRFSISSDPPYPSEEGQDFSNAQGMAIRLSELLSEEIEDQGHKSEKECPFHHHHHQSENTELMNQIAGVLGEEK